MARYKQFWYNSWRSMMARCYNEKSANYKYYGGVGILGVDRKLLIDRLYRGWSEQEIFDTNKYCNQYERRKVCDT